MIERSHDERPSDAKDLDTPGSYFCFWKALNTISLSLATTGIFGMTWGDNARNLIVLAEKHAYFRAQDCQKRNRRFKFAADGMRCEGRPRGTQRTRAGRANRPS